MHIAFTKMHGLGNDFIVFDAPSDANLPSAEQLRALAHRHTGIGFDQAIVLGRGVNLTEQELDPEVERAAHKLWGWKPKDEK